MPKKQMPKKQMPKKQKLIEDTRSGYIRAITMNVWHKIRKGDLPPEDALVARYSPSIGWTFESVSKAQTTFLIRVEHWLPYTHYMILDGPDDRKGRLKSHED